MDDKKITITFHLEENRVTQSFREFYLPSLGGEESQPPTMNPSMTSSYQVSGKGGTLIACLYVINQDVKIF